VELGLCGWIGGINQWFGKPEANVGFTSRLGGSESIYAPACYQCTEIGFGVCDWFFLFRDMPL
jgi:hypothetical protein